MRASILNTLRFFITTLLAGVAPAVRAQSALDGFDPNANGAIRVVVVQPDGKILIGGDFGRDFTTMAGDALRIVQFGVWNREAGPDFAEAAVATNDGEPVRGCIELDPDARDWERHGHAENPNYDSVVLHVFTQRGAAEFFTRTSRHRLVPQVLLDVARLGEEPANPQPEAKPGRCTAPLRELPEDKVREVLLGAAQFRLKRKAAALVRLGELHGAGAGGFRRGRVCSAERGHSISGIAIVSHRTRHLGRVTSLDGATFGRGRLDRAHLRDSRCGAGVGRTERQFSRRRRVIFFPEHPDVVACPS